MLLRAVHITLAFLVLVSSTGVVINAHFCQDQLKSLAIFSHPASCHEMAARAKMPPSCPMHGQMAGCAEDEEDKNCCNNESDYLQLDQDKQVQCFEYKQFDQQLAFNVIWVEQQSELPTYDQKIVQYLNYKPPLLQRDFPSTLQTFLL